MKKKKAAALLLAAAMTVGALPGWAVPTVQAAEVSAGDLTDTDTKRLQHGEHFRMRTSTNIKKMSWQHFVISE